MEVVEGIQRSLKAAGYNPGLIDGSWGPKTEAAHKRMTKAAADGNRKAAELEDEVLRKGDVVSLRHVPQ